MPACYKRDDQSGQILISILEMDFWAKSPYILIYCMKISDQSAAVIVDLTPEMVSSAKMTLHFDVSHDVLP